MTQDDRPRPDRGSPGVPTAPLMGEGVILFDRRGEITAATPGALAFVTPPPKNLADLATRYRQTDGLPIDLWGRTRRVCLPIDGVGPRVLLASEPIAAPNGAKAGTVVAVMPFHHEDDPRTMLRALGSVLAHGLRTPLTTIYAGAELVAAPRLSETTKSAAARSVVREAEHLYRAIEDLIVLVRWDVDAAGAAEPLLVEHILHDVVGRVVRTDGQPPIDLRVERPLAPIVASRGDVEHAIRNVIEHAIGNSPPGGSVVVQAQSDARLLEIRVIDDGPGFDDVSAGRAFELFARSSRATGDPSGANIGLVVARRLVERMGGRTRAVPRPAGGEIVLELPIVT